MYINYTVGADSVRKKLGSAPIHIKQLHIESGKAAGHWLQADENILIDIGSRTNFSCGNIVMTAPRNDNHVSHFNANMESIGYTHSIISNDSYIFPADTAYIKIRHFQGSSGEAIGGNFTSTINDILIS